jgi:hypothetical protein
MSHRLEAYRELERRIQPNTLDALRARWEFGRALLAEREAAGGSRLPNGRREELASALGISPAEINNRVQFADTYAEGELTNALAEFGSWREIVRRGLGNRGRATAAMEPAAAGADAHDTGDEYDAYRIPLPLRDWAKAIAEEACRAGAVPGDNRPGEHAVRALRDFFTGGAEVRRLWEEWLGRAGLREAA